MSNSSPIELEGCDLLEDNRLIVHFSDDTSAIFTAEELASMAVHRFRIPREIEGSAACDGSA